MSRRMHVIGPWGNVEPGKRYGAPFNAGALDRLGGILEAATGDDARAAVEIAHFDIQSLGTALRRVAGGEDARHVFGQNKAGHRPNQRLRIQHIVHVFYRTLAAELAAGKTDGQARRTAIAAAQRVPGGKIKTDTVKRYASMHQDATLAYLKDMHRIGNGPDLAPLLAYLARLTNRIGDGPELPPMVSSRKPPPRERW
jgi:hypothetical protein